MSGPVLLPAGAVEECVGCSVSAGRIQPAGGRELLTPRFSLHARLDGAAVLVMQAVSHYPDLASLGRDAAELGVVLAALTASRAAANARILHIGVLNETLPQHLHVHVVPVRDCVPGETAGPRLMDSGGCSCGNHPHPRTQLAALAAAAREKLAAWPG